jgi:hypothetical protein
MIELAEKSTVEHPAPPSKKYGRFHYASNSVGLFGRDEELKQLKEFCDFDRPLSWWVVIGEKGSGKSKLCYEFSKKMEDEGWTVCAPSDKSLENLHLCSECLASDTLFVLDYAENNMSSIKNWISALGEKGFPGIKIRVLLIQRKFESSAELSDTRFAEITGSKDDLTKNLYDMSLLILLPLPDSSLREIMWDYSSKRTPRQRDIDKAAEDFIFERVNEIDRKTEHEENVFSRLLCVLILTDVYLVSSDVDKIKQWDVTDVLNLSGYIPRSLLRKDPTRTVMVWW